MCNDGTGGEIERASSRDSDSAKAVLSNILEKVENTNIKANDPVEACMDKALAKRELSFVDDDTKKEIEYHQNYVYQGKELEIHIAEIIKQMNLKDPTLETKKVNQKHLWSALPKEWQEQYMSLTTPQQADVQVGIRRYFLFLKNLYTNYTTNSERGQLQYKFNIGEKTFSNNMLSISKHVTIIDFIDREKHFEEAFRIWEAKGILNQKISKSFGAQFYTSITRGFTYDEVIEKKIKKEAIQAEKKEYSNLEKRAIDGMAEQNMLSSLKRILREANGQYKDLFDKARSRTPQHNIPKFYNQALRKNYARLILESKGYTKETIDLAIERNCQTNLEIPTEHKEAS